MKFPFTKKDAPALDQPQDGIRLGYPAENADVNAIEYMLPDALRYHSLIVGKAFTGKDRLLKLLAKAAIERDLSLVVIDATGELAPKLLDQVPTRRADEVAWFDLGNAEQVVGLNLLDVAPERFPDQMISHIVHASERLWKEEWTPFDEDVLRACLDTLLQANAVLAQRGQDQFTLLDLPALLELPAFRRRLLHEYVAEPHTLMWWGNYYEQLYPELLGERLVPFLAKIRALTENPGLRRLLGQPKSALNFRELLRERRIVLINLSQITLQGGVQEWLSDILVALLDSAALDDKWPTEKPTPRDLVVVLNEFEPVSLLESGLWLSGLSRRGVSVILSTHSLVPLEKIQPGATSILMSNVGNLFVFRCLLRDAEHLSPELGQGVTITDLLQLRDDCCYARMNQGEWRLPAHRIHTVLPTDLGCVESREQILKQASTYTRAVKQVEELRQHFEQQWYGREQSLMRQARIGPRHFPGDGDKPRAEP